MPLREVWCHMGYCEVICNGFKMALKKLSEFSQREGNFHLFFFSHLFSIEMLSLVFLGLDIVCEELRNEKMRKV